MIHLVRAVPYDELYAKLLEEHEAGRVFMKRDGPLALFGYTNSCTYDRAWNQWNLIARGLVLDVESKYVVATPFPKFFNYGEYLREIPGVPHLDPKMMLANSSFSVSEKIDGSLGIAFCHDGAWRVVTRGSFVSDQAKWATNWLHDWIEQEAMDPDFTYLFEIVYDENRIVTRYDFQGLVLLSYYDGYGCEAFSEEVSIAADLMGIRRAPYIACKSVQELLDIAKGLPAQQEGFVVRFDSGIRIKIKGDEYCRIHKLISNVTPLAVWEAMANNDDLDNMRKDLPEEFLADFDRIRLIIGKRQGDFVRDVTAAVDFCRGMDDPNTGQVVQLKRDTEPAYKWVFPVRKHGFLKKFFDTGPDRLKAFNAFRPTGNVLEGYTPSTTVSRFQAEEP